MTSRQLLGQLMIIGIKGQSLESDEKRFILDNHIGGVILFSRNIEDPKQLHALTSEIHGLRHNSSLKTPMFIAIDMEGGRVARLKAPFTQWPPAQRLGELDSPTLAFKFAETMGIELKSVGINLDFAPCLDVLTNPNNAVIGDRAISGEPEQVAKLGSAVARGYLKADIIACGKHFPGHGNTLLDSHEDLPIEQDIDLNRLSTVELIPFKRAFRSKLDMVMTAHIKFPKIDPDWPVTLSEIFLKNLLREELGYKQVLITDDLDMKALSKYYDVAELPVRALTAGADLILYCNDFNSPAVALDSLEKAVKDKKLSENDLDQKLQRVLSLKKARLRSIDPKPLTELSKIIGHPEHLRLSRAISTGDIPKDLST